VALIAARIKLLADSLRSGLAEIGAVIHDGGPARSALVTFTVPGHDPPSIQRALSAAGINVSVTAAPWARLDMEQRGLLSAVRASPHAYNSEDEIDSLVEQVGRLGVREGPTEGEAAPAGRAAGGAGRAARGAFDHRQRMVAYRGYGLRGPPAHITLLRRLCVERRHYLAASEFEDGIAATSLLPGPASTQLAIFCAWRLRAGSGRSSEGSAS